jgi:hypothetical protein
MRFYQAPGEATCSLRLLGLCPFQVKKNGTIGAYDTVQIFINLSKRSNPVSAPDLQHAALIKCISMQRRHGIWLNTFLW